MRNGWLPIKMARAMCATAYLTDNNPEKLLVWVRGHGVQFANIYETPSGLVVKVHGFHGDYKVDGFQLCPRGPRSRG